MQHCQQSTGYLGMQQVTQALLASDDPHGIMGNSCCSESKINSTNVEQSKISVLVRPAHRRNNLESPA